MLYWDSLFELQQCSLLFQDGLTKLINAEGQNAQVLTLFDEFTNDIDPERWYGFDVRFLAREVWGLEGLEGGEYKVIKHSYPLISIIIRLKAGMMTGAATADSALGKVLCQMYLEKRKGRNLTDHSGVIYLP